jgi:hypothetical protein
MTHKTAEKVRVEMVEAGSLTDVAKRVGKDGIARDFSERTAAAKKRKAEAAKLLAPVAADDAEDQAASTTIASTADKASGSDVEEIERGDCRLLVGTLSHVARVLEHGCTRAIICDNPLRCALGSATDSDIPAAALEYYREVARLAEKILPEDGALLVPIETFALPAILAAMTKHIAYRHSIYHLHHDAGFTPGRHTTSCDQVLVFSPGTPRDISEHEINEFDASPEVPGNCDLDYLYADDDEWVLYINPRPVDVRSTLSTWRKAIGVYTVGTDIYAVIDDIVEPQQDEGEPSREPQAGDAALSHFPEESSAQQPEVSHPIVSSGGIRKERRPSKKGTSRKGQS